MPMADLTVPRFEPEIVAARARRFWRGDDEKVATTAVPYIQICGALIESRYQKADELERMAAIFNLLPHRDHVEIARIWCDSKATHSYSVTLWKWEKNLAIAIGILLSDAAIRIAGGHNGIVVAAENGSTFGDCDRSIDIDPWWDGDA
jgi:hypothetical protein